MHHSKLVLMSLVMATGFAGSSLVVAQDMTQSAAPPAAAVQNSTAAPGTSFNALDKHHHGYLVRSDVPHSMKNLRLHFGEADYNHDGRLSPAEYAQYARTYHENFETQQDRQGFNSGYESSVRAAADAKLATPNPQGMQGGH